MRTVKMKPPRWSRSALLDSVQPRRSRSGFSGPRVRGQEHQGSPALALSPGSLLPTPEVQSSFCGSWRLVSTRPSVTRKTSLQQARPGRTGQCGSRLGLTGVAAGGDVPRQGPGPRAVRSLVTGAERWDVSTPPGRETPVWPEPPECPSSWWVIGCWAQ